MLGWYIKLKKNHRQCFMCHQIFFIFGIKNFKREVLISAIYWKNYDIDMLKKKQCCKQFEICFRSKNYRIWFQKKNPSIKIIIAENQNC